MSNTEQQGASGVPVTEGYMPFGEYRTYYRIAGDVQKGLANGKAPLLCLHGGPGSTHNYMELLDPLTTDGRAVISYDQLGCGDSYVEGHPELWRADTWVRELAALVDYLGLSRYHLLGQSWGGMLEITYLVDRQPKGVLSATLSSTLPSSQLWGREQHRMARMLPADEYQALMDAEATGDFTGAAYQRAIDHYMELHCADLHYGPDAPECLRRPKRSGTESYLVAWGPNELMPQGTLKDWDYTDRLGQINVPTLVVDGTDDLCTPLIAKTMYDGIPGARWELFEGCRHMCYADDTPRYLRMMRDWLAAND
jgi:proline iminopeptidase